MKNQNSYAAGVMEAEVASEGRAYGSRRSKKVIRTAPPTQLEVEAKIEGFYSEYVILAQTQNKVLIGVNEDDQVYSAMIFEIDQKNFWCRIGYIGMELVRMEKRDLDAETFTKTAMAAFAALK